MFWVTLGCILTIGPKFALAQSSTVTTSSAVPTVSVSVGAAGHLFTPENITANVGDIIEFRFYPLNHSVAKAVFQDPCIPAEYHEGVTGFWSGFHPMQAILSQPPTFQIKINDTKPIFFYCSAPGACEDGMVGVINANSTQTLVIQKEFAKNATLMLSPGEPIPAERAKSTSSSSSAMPSTTSALSTASVASTTATTSPSPTPAASSSSRLSDGAIAGIAIGGAAVLILVGAVVYLCGRQRTLGEMIQRQQQPPIPPPYNPGAGHMSMLSPPGSYTPKMYMENDPLNSNRYSNQTGGYERSAGDTESYRSRSPGVDENGEALIPPMNFGGGQRNYSPTRGASPPMVRPIPQSPGRVNTMSSPVTPMGPVQEERAEYPVPLRTTRMNSHKGPHELAVENERNYIPYGQRNEGVGMGHGA